MKCASLLSMDDIILATEKDESMKEIKKMIVTKSSVKDMGELHCNLISRKAAPIAGQNKRSRLPHDEGSPRSPIFLKNSWHYV